MAYFFACVRVSLLSSLCLLPLAVRCQSAPRVRQDSCANGIFKSSVGGVNGEVELCGAIARTDPKLAAQMEQVLQLLSQNQTQMKALTRTVNTLGGKLNSSLQQEMAWSLVTKLGTDPATVSAKARYLTTSLETVAKQVTESSNDPAQEALLQQKLQGSLGNSIAQLDADMAKAELNDIRNEVHKIDTTTERTDKTVRDIQRTIDIQLHPERALPPEEGKLYTQMVPLMQEIMTFHTRWVMVESKYRQEHAGERMAAVRAQTTGAPIAGSSGYAAELQRGLEPSLAEYRQTLLPELNVWRAQLIERVPQMRTNSTAFASIVDISGARASQSNVRLLLQQYTASDPRPSPDLARKGHELLARVSVLTDHMQQTMVTASTAASQQRAAYVPPAVPDSATLLDSGKNYVEGVDGPMRAEFQADLEPRLRQWQASAKEFFPTFKITDFSDVKTSWEMQEKQIIFNGQIMKAYQAIGEQVRNASGSTP